MMSRGNIALIVLGVFLLLTGLMNFIIEIENYDYLISLLAVVVGILILLFTPPFSFEIGWIFAGIYLVIFGLVSVFNIRFAGIEVALAVLRIIIGVTLLLGWPGLSRHIGFTVFCLWNIFTGVSFFLPYDILPTIGAYIAVISGVFLILVG